MVREQHLYLQFVSLALMFSTNMCLHCGNSREQNGIYRNAGGCPFVHSQGNHNFTFYRSHNDECACNLIMLSQIIVSRSQKVDFNAGVVAAGESQIESTVIGNMAMTVACDEDSALKDQSQIYLPINNALTNVG
jgi:hypothetical protein